MPDRTQQTLDDLADLFLTSSPAPRKPTDSVREPAPQRAVTVPTPSKPQPQPQTRAQPRPTPRTPRVEPNPTPAPRLEAVLLGNLPGMAHVWLTQYAQLLAEQEGPVLLLTINPDHDEDGAIEAELVEPRVGDVLHRFSPQSDADDPDDWFAPFPQTGATRVPEAIGVQNDIAALLGFDPARTAPAPEAHGHRPWAASQTGSTNTRSLATVLHQHLADRDTPVATILIYTDTDPREIDRLLDVGVWTLLTGADPTAIVAAQRGLKTLADADPQSRTAEVGVFVVGSPPDKANAAADQIAAACADLFDTPVATLGHLQKMRPAAVRTLGTYPSLDTQWTDLIAALDTLNETQPSAEPTRQEARDHRPRVPDPQPPSAPPILQRSVLDTFFAHARQKPRDTAPADATSVRPAAPKPARRVEPEPVAASAANPLQSPEIPRVAQVAAAPEPRRLAATASPSPIAQGHGQFRADEHDREPDLPALLADADPDLDLRPLPVRCPEHPHLHLAADALGRLHLLARLTDADHPRPTLLALTDARRWATQHRALLALAMTARDAQAPDVNPGPPILHLFTDQPDRAVPLAAAIDPTIRLHLLQHLPLAAGPTWLATALQTSD